MIISDNYLNIENIPTKSKLEIMSVEKLEELLARVDKCPHSRSRESSYPNELCKNLPLWKIYRELILKILGKQK
jgi:hypothetical protein